MKKLTFVLIFIFALSFLNSISYGEEAAPSNIEASTSASADTSDASVKPEAPPTDSQAAKPEESPESPIDVTTIATATGKGPFIPSEAIQTDTFTGTANMSIPINVANGRKGIQPNLAISYNSSSGNGWCGVGWLLDLGSIQRSTKFGPPAYNDLDNFVFVQGGSAQDLVNIGGGEYRAKTEGAFMKFTYQNGYWIIKDKKGTTYYFGVTAQARQLNPNNSLTFKWCLEAVKDLTGNYMNISYLTDNHQIYPQAIRYTGLTTEALPPFSNENLFGEVNFILEDRTDIISNYSTGGGGTGGAQAIKTTKRLKTIEVKAEDNLVRKYVFDYHQSERTSRSLISQVTVYADNGTTALPPTTFTYQEINDTTYTILNNNITNHGNNLWNVQFDSGDYFHSNEWILYPWGQFSNGQTINGWSQTYTQASFSNQDRSWTIDANGNFNYWAVQDTAFHAWTYIYVPNATTITIPWSADLGFMWLNGDYSTGGGTHTFNLNAGYNILEITGYNQNDNSPFNLNYALASNVSVMHSYWFAKPQLTGDFNGDGLTDFATFDNYGGIWRVVLSFGSGFFPDQIWLSGMGNNNTIPLVGDFNNDGKADVCSFDKTTGTWQFAYSNGQNGFTLGTTFNTSWVNYKPMIGDYNGDGFLDLCGFNPVNGNWYVALANGQGGFNSPQVWAYTFGAGENKLPLGGDFNGDGLTDALYFDKPNGNWYVAFSNGTNGFVESTSNPWATGFGNDKEPIIVDFNVDGLTDIGYLNRQNSQLVIRTSNGSSAFINPQNWVTNFTITSGNMVAQIGDYNGDGLIDPAVFDPFTNAAQVGMTSGKISDLLSAVNNGVGGSSTINYLPSTLFPNYGSDNFNDLPFVAQVVSNTTTSDGLGNQYTTSYYYKDGLYDVADREFRGFGYAKVTDPVGTTNETYFYQDDIRKGCSYHEGEIRDASGNLYQQILNDWDYVQPYGEEYNIYFRRLLHKTTYLYNGDTQEYGQFTKQTRTEYEYGDYGDIIHVAALGDWDTGADDKHSYTSYLYNTENNLLSLPKYTYLTDNEGNIVKYSWLYYDNHSSIEELPTLGNLTKQEDWFQTSTNPAPVPGNSENPKTTFTYDTYGNLLTTTDAIGNTTPEPNDRTTTIVYDPTYHLFPLTTTNSLGHIITNAYYGINGVPLNEGLYHGLWGQVKSSTDTNDVTTTTIYDNFGRTIKTVGQNDTAELPAALVEYNLLATPINIVTHSRIEHGEPETVDSITFYDGLGRPIQVKTYAEEGAPYPYIASGGVTFNERGLPHYKYLNFYTDSFTSYTSPIGQAPYASVNYDAIGRVIELVNPDGTSGNTSYYDWTTTSIDPNGHMGKSYKDALGRLIKVEEYSGADGRDPINYSQTQGPVEDYYTLYSTTDYYYDSSNNLTDVYDQFNNYTNITYDTMNRKTSMTDPDMGYWTYSYDLVGNLTSQTDAKGQIINFAYDDMNRLLTKSYPNSTNQPVNYTYDDIAVPYSKGRLTKALYSSNEDTKFYYDNLGREIQSTKKIDSTEYNIYRTYDALGRLKTLTYPDGEVLTYTYNLQGQIESIKNQSNYFYVQNTTYNENNQITHVTYGNNTQTTYNYSGTTLRLTNLLTQNSQSATLQNSSYSFDNSGNVLAITDGVNSNDQVFTYDALNRLTSANGTESYGLKTYSYNEIGNILNKEGIDFGYTSTRPHAVTLANSGSTAFTYDNNGNMTSVVSPTYYVPNSVYEYDAENRLTKAVNSDQAATTYFYYDGDGGRTKKYSTKTNLNVNLTQAPAPTLQQKVWEFLIAVNPLSVKEANADSYMPLTITSTNIYVGQNYEIVSGNNISTVTKKYIFLGPNRICSVENGSKYYHHGDHLNSSNIITDNTGLQQKLLQYMPYGGTSVDTGSYETSYRFTGKELDDETGLYYYGARYYHPLIGRFISADSIVQAPNNPQTLNRYSYCINNPIRYTDPSGHGLFDWLGNLFQSIGNLFRNLWNNIIGPIISAIVTVVVIVAIALIPGGQTVAVALAAQATWVAAAAAAATTATLQTPEGQQFIQRFANEVFDDIFGMSPKAAYMAASIISYMGLNMAYQFAFATLTLPDAKKITGTKEFNPNTDQSIARDIINNGGGENYGLRPFLDESGNLVMAPNTSYQILYSGDDPVGIIAKALDIAGGDQHIGIILKGLSTTVDLPSFFGDPLGALSQGYLTAGISHTAVNISLLQWGSTMTIGNIGGGWTTAVSTFVYGPYGGGLVGATTFNEINK